ncbi:hypothetical protein WJX72_003348 [[Myrmecia] bisecta]|uniref:Uncharacterized protein n=1 Tax=[Myrmecia] bisecta TaxID=41462 RepID=A0AAW1PL12_9CHLO
MNRRLLDPFQIVDLPEIIEEYLDDGITKCVSFNHRGTLLAAGCADGRVVIWDFETRGVAQTYQAHGEGSSVTCLAWSRNGRFLVSGGMDHNIIVQNVEQNIQHAQMTLPGIVTHMSLDERNADACVVGFQVGPPMLLDFAASTMRPLPTVVIDGEGRTAKANVGGTMLTVMAIFDKTGSLLFVAQPKGTIAVLETTNLRFLDLIKVPGGTRIMGLRLNRKGNLLLVNCYDRVIRMYECQASGAADHKTFTLQEVKSRVATAAKGSKGGSVLLGDKSLLTFKRDFQNAVERMLWKEVVFTGDSEYVVAASNAKAEHIIYIWNRNFGKLERILEGPKEGTADIAWHPNRDILVSVSVTGKIYLWAKVYQENWSAFAPDFEELHENQEYVEREDEFDTNEREEDRAARERALAARDEADDEVDILTVEEAPVFSSDDEGEGEALHHLPVQIRPQEAEAKPAPEAGPSETQGSEADRLEAEPSTRGADEGEEPPPEGSARGRGMDGEDMDLGPAYPMPSEQPDDPGARHKRIKLKVRFPSEEGGDAEDYPGASKKRRKD